MCLAAVNETLQYVKKELRTPEVCMEAVKKISDDVGELRLVLDQTPEKIQH